MMSKYQQFTDVRFVSVSLASLAIWGYAKHELIGRFYIDFVVEEDREITNLAAKRILSGEATTSFENHYRHKNGSKIPVLWSARWDENEKLMYCIAKDATEKKRLEKAFENERVRFYELFQDAPSSMGILKGPNHVFTIVNPLYLKLIGKNDIIGKPVKEVLPEVIDQGFILILDTVYKTGNTYSANQILIRLDQEGTGKLIDKYLNFLYQAYKNKDGIIEGIFFFIIDVTEQVLSRKKIEESERKYRQIVETAQEGIWMTDENQKTTFVNKKLCDILGYSSEEMLGKESRFFMDGAGREIADRTAEIRTTGESEEMEISLLTKLGKKIWVSLSGSAIFDENGKYKSGLSMVKDITGQKASAERLEASEFRLKEAESIAHLGNWETDIKNNIHSWSDEIYKILGMDKGEIIPSQEALLSFFDSNDLNRVNKEITLGLENLQNISFDIKFVRKDGVIRYGYNEWKFKLDNENHPNKLFGILQDITERKLAEEERKKIVSDLVSRNKDLEQFTYIVSHNLRAPVANILGAGALMKDPETTTETKNVLTQGINESIVKLDHVLKDLNHILEVKQNVNEKKELVFLSTLMEDIKISVSHLMPLEDLNIKYNFSELNELVTLKSYIYSIFYNLISNSIKYRRHFQKCNISVLSKVSVSSMFLIFEDNGRGIDLSRSNQIFGLYKRFHADMEGKGIGLFMVKTQVELLGGVISVESRVDQGTTFTIEFKIL